MLLINFLRQKIHRAVTPSAMRWLLLPMVALAVASCGGGGDTGETASPPPPPPPPPPLPLDSSYHCGKGAFVNASVGGISRTWTPSNASANTAFARGAPFQGTALRVWNEETGRSREIVTIRRSDNCVRNYLSASFVSSDRDALNQLRQTETGVQQLASPPTVDARVAAAAAAARALDSKTYQTVDFNNAFAAQKNGTANRYETQHFAFWWGNDTTTADGKLVATPGFIQLVGAWYEIVWAYYASALSAPMPFSASASPSRINVSIYNTGLAWAKSGYANAAASMALSADASTYGSSVVGHEFGHVVQYYTGGFRNSPSVGGFWETHAQFGGFSFEPTGILPDFPILLSNLQNGIFWQGARYANFPFLRQLWETDTTHDLLFSMWTNNLRDAQGAAIEDPAETLVRLGQASGAFPEGWKSFGDTVGLYAARLVHMDFFDQTYMLHAAGNNLKTATATLISDTQPGWFVAPVGKVPAQLGITLVKILPAPASSTLTVKVRGLSANPDAAWRATLVAVDALGNSRYSSVVRVEGATPSEVSLAVREGERYTLAIAATPYQWTRVPFAGVGSDAASLARFPFAVSIIGGAPQ